MEDSSAQIYSFNYSKVLGRDVLVLVKIIDRVHNFYCKFSGSTEMKFMQVKGLMISNKCDTATDIGAYYSNLSEIVFFLKARDEEVRCLMESCMMCAITNSNVHPLYKLLSNQYPCNPPFNMSSIELVDMSKSDINGSCN